MGILDSAVDIQELGQRNFWVLYGKSNSGKTYVASTFPKPLLYIQIGDDGSNTIARVEGIKAISIENIEQFKALCEELKKDKKYATIVVDTFSMVVNEWVQQKVTTKGKKMTQQLWGDLKTEQEELIKALQRLAKKHIVVATCHESMDTIEGMEDEITPDIRPSVSKGARTYLEGMANYGIHTTKIIKEVTKGNETKEVVKYAADIGPNPYYWTKLQVDPSIKVPKRIINPTYDKFMEVIGQGE
nr:MAG TPA: AAA domain protein [Bacteriophage sp.]